MKTLIMLMVLASNGHHGHGKPPPETTPPPTSSGTPGTTQCVVCPAGVICPFYCWIVQQVNTMSK